MGQAYYLFTAINKNALSDKIDSDSFPFLKKLTTTIPKNAS